MDLISVIVPIYNVEIYLEECLYSLSNQKYPNYEVILVDDGSTDNSESICKNFIIKHNTFRYVKKINGGLSSARNYGIKLSNGKWICFVDSDDCVSPNYLKDLYNGVKKNRTDICVCNYTRNMRDISLYSKTEPINAVYDKKSKYDFLKDFDSPLFIVSWNKIYKKELFNNISFPEGRIHEDLATTFMLIDRCDYVTIVNRKLYFYRRNPSGISRSLIDVNKIDYSYALICQAQYFNKLNYNNNYRKIIRRSSNMAFSSIGTLLNYGKRNYIDYSFFKKNVSSFYRDNYFILKQLDICFIYRIVLLLSFKHVSLLKELSVIKKILKQLIGK